MNTCHAFFSPPCTTSFLWQDLPLDSVSVAFDDGVFFLRVRVLLEEGTMSSVFTVRIRHQHTFLLTRTSFFSGAVVKTKINRLVAVLEPENIRALIVSHFKDFYYTRTNLSDSYACDNPAVTLHKLLSSVNGYTKSVAFEIFE